jgi:hypothetical protein
MPRPTRYVVLLVATLVLVTGCAQQRQDVRRQATAAALASYPGNPQKSERVQVAAVDYRKDGRIELFNLGDNPVTSPTVWVNKTYVSKAATIPPRGSVSVRYAELIQQGEGVQDLTTTKQPVTTVELETADGLYSALGPARK